MITGMRGKRLPKAMSTMILELRGMVKGKTMKSGTRKMQISVRMSKVLVRIQMIG